MLNPMNVILLTSMLDRTEMVRVGKMLFKEAIESALKKLRVKNSSFFSLLVGLRCLNSYLLISYRIMG